LLLIVEVDDLQDEIEGEGIENVKPSIAFALFIFMLLLLETLSVISNFFTYG